MTWNKIKTTPLPEPISNWYRMSHDTRGGKYWKTILTKAKSEGFKVYVLKNDSEKIPLDDINHIDKYFTSAIYKFVIEKS